jgi:6-pyruvoyltetrahydropterin/6-carboxytetrahydropterin synthase
MSEVPFPRTICKAFKFHAAHHIPTHHGQCQRPHGHTYKLEVFVKGLPITDKDQSGYGMVMDFDEIKEAYRLYVEPYVEHENLNITLQRAGKVPTTTAEHLVDWMFDVLHEALHHQVVRVRLWETETSYAEIEK